MQAIPQDQFRAAMARFPGAVTVVTTRTDAGERRGITATAFSSVSAEPPSVLVCLNRATGTCATVEETGVFAVNLLSSDQHALALRFAGQGGISGADKFAEGDWGLAESDLPVLSDAAVSLCCKVSDSVLAGTHRIYIGQIMAVVQGRGAALVYEGSRFQRLSPL